MDLLDELSEYKYERTSDDLSFEAVFTRCYPGLVYFSYRIIGNKLEAEDIVQDTFVNYWHHQKQVPQNLNAIKSFLYTAVKNASLNIIKHQKVIHKFEVQLPINPIEERTIENEMIRSEVISEIHLAIKSLPANCRKIAIMSYIDGRKNQEIADELGLSINTIKTQKQRAISLLRQKLTLDVFCLFLFFVLL